MWVDTHFGAGGVELLLVEVGLEAGFEDVKGGSEGGGCHASDSGGGVSFMRMKGQACELCFEGRLTLLQRNAPMILRLALASRRCRQASIDAPAHTALSPSVVLYVCQMCL